MKVRLDDDGLNAVLSNLSGINPSRAVTATAFEIAKRAKQHTPQGKTRGLVNSIRTEVSGSTGVVGYTAEYAPHVEYGHRQNVGQYVPAIGKRLKVKYVPGQHFLRRAVAEAKPEIERALRTVVEEAER